MVLFEQDQWRAVAAKYQELVFQKITHSPVVHDIKVRILFVIMIMLKLAGKIADGGGVHG